MSRRTDSDGLNELCLDWCRIQSDSFPKTKRFGWFRKMIRTQSNWTLSVWTNSGKFKPTTLDS